MKYSSIKLMVLGMGVVLLGLNSVAWAERGLQRNKGNETTTTPYSNGVYRALVIGNNSYKDPERIWTPLKTAVEDAKSVAKVLKQDYGFTDINLLTNASRRDILVALTKIHKVVKKYDNVLIYYAGHGYLNKTTDEAYWIPIDAQGWDDSYFLSNARIKEKLAVIAAKANHTLIVSDSCFSGTLLRGGNTIPKEFNEPYFRKIAQRKSVQILAAGGVEFVDDNYRRSGHSPFTYFFLKELKNNNQRLFTTTSLTSNLARVVANNVQQTPQSGILHGAGDEGGEFIFTKVTLNKPSSPKITKQQTYSPIQSIKIDPLAVELSFWNSVKEIDTPDLYLAYLKKFPEGTFAEIAKHKLNLIAPRNPEINAISEIIGRYKLTLEAQNKDLIHKMSELQPGRDEFITQLFNHYRSFQVNISGFKHINKEHRASALISIEDLIDNQGRKVKPGGWSKFDILVSQNKAGDWRIIW